MQPFNYVHQHMHTSADILKFPVLGKEGVRLCSLLNATLVHENLLQYQRLNINKNNLCIMGKDLDAAK